MTAKPEFPPITLTMAKSNVKKSTRKFTELIPVFQHVENSTVECILNHEISIWGVNTVASQVKYLTKVFLRLI